MNPYENYLFEVTLSDENDYLLDIRRSPKVRTIKDTSDEDFKTAIALRIPSIPKGTELVVEDVTRNFYGIFLDVRYGGYLYYINPRNVEYAGMNK